MGPIEKALRDYEAMLETLDWEDIEKEVIGMADELAGKMAEMTIGVEEDEIADAQGTMHDLRVVKAKREEQVELLMAEKRRIEFALAELSGRHD